MDHLMPLALIAVVVVFAFVLFGLRRSSKDDAPVRPAGGFPRPSAIAGHDRMVADMRATKTSRVVDEVAILDELSQTNPGFRQYCELVGAAQSTGGVIAPYSRREVAYYEIRCYRIENRGGGDIETLVAHERSFEPFSFTDASCDEPVYVDLESFGDHVILVNSTNHIEGPNSEFTRAADAAGARGATGSSVSAIVGGSVRGARFVPCDVADALERPARAIESLARAVASGIVLQPSLACVGTGAGVSGVGAIGPNVRVGRTVVTGAAHAGPRVSCAGPGGRSGPRGGGAPGFGRGGRSAPGTRPAGPRGPGGSGLGMPPGMGDFLGGMGMPGGFSGVPRSRPRSGGGDVFVGMALGSLLASLAANEGTQRQDPGSSFRGYRLVEDVVPLGSPVYCIGEIYRSGARVHMGKSLSADYPTSYFATRPEAEVLSALGA